MADRSPAARTRVVCCNATAQRTASADEATVVISPSRSHFTSWLREHSGTLAWKGP